MMKAVMGATVDEEMWFANLRRLLQAMPQGVWIFVANDTVNMMRLGKEGQIRKPVTARSAGSSGGGVDQKYILDSFTTRIDGGDW